MKKIVLLATMALLVVVLFTSVAGTAAAEPQKNQILIPTTCDDGQSYTFVINGMSKVGQILGSNNNFVVTAFTVTYRYQNGDLVEDTFGHGKAENSQKDLISCSGRITTELQAPGGEPEEVTADFTFQGFVAPGANR